MKNLGVKLGPFPIALETKYILWILYHPEGIRKREHQMTNIEVDE